jgi:hypothetical protein
LRSKKNHPHVLAQEIVEDFEAGVEQFREFEQTQALRAPRKVDCRQTVDENGSLSLQLAAESVT